MKIRAFSEGGVAYLPTVNTSENGAVSTAASSSSKSGDSTTKVPGFTKELLDMIKEKGLDSDVSTFINHATRLMDLASDPTGENLSMREIMALTMEASKVTTNYENSKKASDRLDSEDAWGEVAMDSRGRVYTMDDKGKVTAMSAKEAMDGNHVILTNADLMEARMSNPKLAYSSDLINSMRRAVGMKTVEKYITDIVKTFETTEMTGYSTKKGNRIRSGLQQIIDGKLTNGNTIDSIITQGPDGVYKVTEESTIADRDVNAAVQHIMSSLPSDYRKTLEANALLTGYDPESYLLTKVLSSTKRKIAADYDAQLSSAASGGGSGSGKLGATKTHTLAESYADGQDLPGMPTMIPISPAGSSSTMLAYGQDAGVILNKDGKTTMPVASFDTVLNDAYGLRQVTTGTLCFGDQLLDDSEKGGVVYDSSNMYRVVMPYKIVRGKDIVPDFELQERIDEVVKRETNKGSDPEVISRYVNEVCPGARYDATSGGVTLPRERLKAFMAAKGVAADNYIKFDKDSPYLAKSDMNADIYREAVNYGYANHGKNDPQKIAGTASKHGWGKTANHLYEGMVYMPIISEVAGTSVFNQEVVPQEQYVNITGRALEHEREMRVSEALSNQHNTNW